MFSGGQLKAPETVSAVCTLDHESAGGRQGFPDTCIPALWSSAALCTDPLPSCTQSDPAQAQRWYGRWCSLTQSSWGQVPDGKQSMGLFSKGTGNSSYGQTRGGVRWVSRNSQVREKNKNLHGRKSRGKTKEKAGNGMRLVLGQSHSRELWSRSQDHVGCRWCSWGPMTDAGGRISKVYSN